MSRIVRTFTMAAMNGFLLEETDGTDHDFPEESNSKPVGRRCPLNLPKEIVASYKPQRLISQDGASHPCEIRQQCVPNQ